MWTCPSMRPGITVLPATSVTSYSDDGGDPLPTDSIVPSRIRTTAPSIGVEPVPSMSRALTMARGCAAGAGGWLGLGCRGSSCLGDGMVDGPPARAAVASGETAGALGDGVPVASVEAPPQPKTAALARPVLV